MVRRVMAVLVVSLISVAFWAPDIPRIFGHPLGTPGFYVGRGDVVLSVDRGSPAERAGIRSGQLIDFAATPLHSRLLLVNSNFQNLHPIQSFPVRVVSDNGAFTVMVTSEPESKADTATVLPRMLFALILLVAGIALFLMRPSKATAAFFVLTAFSSGGAPVNAIIWSGPTAYQVLMTIMSTPLYSSISEVGAVIFALNLLVRPPIALWRRIAEATIYAIAIVIVAISGWSIISSVYYGTAIGAGSTVIFGLQIAAAVAPPLLLFTTYAASGLAIRERIRWVIFAFVVNAAVFGVLFLTSERIVEVTLPYWLWATLAGVNTLTMTFAVLYAVLKHHVIDINVAISRALVYTLLSTLIVGTFALVDLLFTRTVSGRSAGLIADIALALVLGFFFNALHYRVDRFVDRVLFKARHAAEEHLRTVIRGIPFAISEAQIDRLLVEEPVRSFDLTGAALFACFGSVEFELRHFCGVPPNITVTSREEALPAYLQGERCAMRLNKHGWEGPAVAIPVFSHGNLAAIVLYGLHRNGTDLDTEEIALFENVAGAAGNAYDRLEAQRLREEVRDLRTSRI